MKRISLLTMLVGLLAIVSCGSDDSPKLGLEMNDVTYDDINGFYADYGLGNYGTPARDEVETSTHRWFYIMLTDGIMGAENCLLSDHSWYFNLNLYSPDQGTDLTNGTYDITYYFPNGQDQTGKQFGTFGGYFEAYPDYNFAGAEGTITISGDFPSITAKVDLDFYYYDNSTPQKLEGGATEYFTLTGTFKGTVVENCFT